jgi:hypothetical protein
MGNNMPQQHSHPHNRLLLHLLHLLQIFSYYYYYPWAF